MGPRAVAEHNLEVRPMIRESRSNRRPVPGGPTAARRTALKVVGALLGAALVLSAVIAPAFADEERER
jgi:hypothetical protein